MTKVNYEYTVITKETSEELHFDKRFWENHPDWKYFVRTSVKHPKSGSSLGGGGVTKQDAIASAESSIKFSLASEVQVEINLATSITKLERKTQRLILQGEEAAVPIDVKRGK